MQFTIESLAPCRKKISVSIPQERVKEAFEEKYNELNSAVALPGFRPGKAPRKLLEKRFGTHLGPEVRESLLKETLTSLVEDEKVQPLSPPDIDVESLDVQPDAGLEFSFELVTKPEFETPEYKGLDVRVPPVSVTDEMVDEAIDEMRRRDARLETVEEAEITKDDVLIVDWQAKDGDSVEAQDNGAYYPYPRGVLAGFVVDGLDDQLAGKGAGAEATAEVEVAPDDRREELRGRKLTLSVQVKEVKRYVLPEIDAAWLEARDFDDMDELREDTRKELNRHVTRLQGRQAEARLVDQLVEAVEISLPEEFVESELENWAQRKRIELQMEQTDEGEIEGKLAEGRTDARESIEADMRQHFLLERIAEAEGLEATEQELAMAIQEIAQAYGRPFEDVLASFRDGGRLGELQSQVLQRKAREVIRSAANLIEDASLADDGEQEADSKKKASKKKK